MTDIEQRDLVRTPHGQTFFDRKKETSCYVYGGTLVRVFRVETWPYKGLNEKGVRKLWVETLNGRCEGVISSREVIRLSPLEQLAAVAVDDG